MDRRLARAAVAIAMLSSVVTGVMPASAQHAYTQAGHVRIGTLRDIDNLNPLLSNEAAVGDIAQFLFSGLIRVDDRGELIGDAAREVPTQRNGGISADGRTIVYHLRPNVRFADGVALTAADVVFTWRAVLNPKNNAPNHFPYDQAVSVTAADPRTVVVRLKRPSSPFVSAFFSCAVQGVILPKHLLEGKRDLNRDPFNRKPVGSGAFAVVRYEPGNRVEMVPNPYWYGGKPKLTHVTFRIIPNENSLLVALRTHEIDFYTGAPEGQLRELRAIDGIRTSAVPFAQFEMVVFNTRRAPFDDLRVRRAAAHAIDWKRLARTVYLGIDVPDWGDIYPGSWAYTAQPDPTPYDPARARTLLDAAGWVMGSDGIRAKSGRRLEATISTVAGVTTRQNVEINMQQQLRDVGIDLHIQNAPAGLLFAPAGAGGLISSGKFDLTMYSWVTRPDPDDSTTAGPENVAPYGSNDSGLADAELGRLQRAAAATYDRAKRKAIYAQVERRLGTVLPYHTIVWRANVNAWNDDLHGVRPAHIGSDFWNAPAWSI
jgi:peptide/nickel transport system substrate-binding protein